LRSSKFIAQAQPSNLICRNYSKRRTSSYAFKTKQYPQTQFKRNRFIQESTPELFNHRSLKTRGMFKVLDLKDMMTHPVVPAQMIDHRKHDVTKRQRKRGAFVDFTKYTNSEWMKRQRRKLLAAMEQTDVYVDMFAKYVDHPMFKGTLKRSLNHNLVVKYDAPVFEKKDIKINVRVKRRVNFMKMISLTEENIYRSQPIMGNYLPVGTAQQKPTFHFEATDPKKLYTLVMFTMDHPFRLVPDKGVMVHWLVTNIPGSDISKGDEVLSYLPPIPSEYAGTFRYVFALYPQVAKQDFSQRIKNGEFKKGSSERELSKEDRQRMDDLRKQMRNGSYAYEQEYIEQQIQEQFGFQTAFQDHDRYPVTHSDYRAPKPENADMSELDRRRGLDLEKITNITLPCGLVFFRTEHDFCVTELYEKNNWEEPFYVPPDERQKTLVQEYQVFQGKRFKNIKQMRDQWL